MLFEKLENDILIRTALGEKNEKVPVWLMRQAGRILSEYRKVRSRFPDFKEFVKNPDAAAEVTVQPVDILDVDAAIIFSDILVIPEAMGVDYIMEEKKGPLFPRTIQTLEDIQSLETNIGAKLDYVTQAIQKSKELLQSRVPLIGFAGAPWTIFAYIIEGSGSKTFTQPRVWLYKHPEWSHLLLQKITDATLVYLQNQINAGANLIQIFDSWAGILSPKQYNEFALPYIQQLCDAFHTQVPVTVFSKGANGSLSEISKLDCHTVGLDWNVQPEIALKELKGKTIQGNLDPCALFADKKQIEQSARNLVRDFETVPHIVNLGHGLYPDTPRENVIHFVKTIKTMESITV